MHPLIPSSPCPPLSRPPTAAPALLIPPFPHLRPWLANASSPTVFTALGCVPVTPCFGSGRYRVSSRPAAPDAETASQAFTPAHARSQGIAHSQGQANSQGIAHSQTPPPSASSSSFWPAPTPCLRRLAPLVHACAADIAWREGMLEELRRMGRRGDAGGAAPLALQVCVQARRAPPLPFLFLPSSPPQSWNTNRPPCSKGGLTQFLPVHGARPPLLPPSLLQSWSTPRPHPAQAVT